MRPTFAPPRWPVVTPPLTSFLSNLGLDPADDDANLAAAHMLSENLLQGDALTMQTTGGKPITFAEWGYLVRKIIYHFAKNNTWHFLALRPFMSCRPGENRKAGPGWTS